MLAAIAGGSACGGLIRHLLTEATTRITGAGFPWGTVLVNVSGSVAIGAIAALMAGGAGDSWSPGLRHATVTGLLGGFTTFSTFSVQTLSLVQQGQAGAAAANVVLSVGLGLAGCWAGFSAVASLGGR